MVAQFLKIFSTLGRYSPLTNLRIQSNSVHVSARQNVIKRQQLDTTTTRRSSLKSSSLLITLTVNSLRQIHLFSWVLSWDAMLKEETHLEKRKWKASNEKYSPWISNNRFVLRGGLICRANKGDLLGYSLSMSAKRFRWSAQAFSGSNGFAVSWYLWQWNKNLHNVSCIPDGLSPPDPESFDTRSK